jgi:predicted membrane protein
MFYFKISALLFWISAFLAEFVLIFLQIQQIFYYTCYKCIVSKLITFSLQLSQCTDRIYLPSCLGKYLPH